MRRPFPLRSATVLLLALAGLTPALQVRAAGSDALRLTRAADVRALSAKVAESKLPVTLRGVVTAAEPDWAGKFVIQDESAGIFVQNTSGQPAIGDYVEVIGWTGPGWYAPVVQTNHW